MGINSGNSRMELIGVYNNVPTIVYNGTLFDPGTTLAEGETVQDIINNTNSGCYLIETSYGEYKMLIPCDMVTINTFIPMNYIDNPTPFSGSIFEGDNRHGGSPDRATWNERGSHRTHIEFSVVPWQIADTDGQVDGLLGNTYVNDPDGLKNDRYYVHIGTSHEYNKATSLDASGNISTAAKADTSLHDGKHENRRSHRAEIRGMD